MERLGKAVCPVVSRHCLVRRTTVAAQWSHTLLCISNPSEWISDSSYMLFCAHKCCDEALFGILIAMTTVGKRQLRSCCDRFPRSRSRINSSDVDLCTLCQQKPRHFFNKLRTKICSPNVGRNAKKSTASCSQRIGMPHQRHPRRKDKLTSLAGTGKEWYKRSGLR